MAIKTGFLFYKKSPGTWLLLIAIVISISGGFGTAIWIAKEYITESMLQYVNSYEYSQKQTEIISQKLDAEFLSQKKVVDEFSDQLTTGKIQYEEIIPAIHLIVEKKPNLSGIIVCFSPGIFQGKKLYGPSYLLNQKGQFDDVQIEKLYDYTDPGNPNSKWYQQIAGSEKGEWIKQIGMGGQDSMIIYGSPFFQVDQKTGKKTIAGVVASVHSVDTTLKQFMQSIDLGQDGYAILVAEDGETIYHPNPDLINSTIDKIASMIGDKTLQIAAKRQLRGENFVIERKSINQTSSWTTFKLIPTTHWTVVTVVYQTSIYKPTPIIQKKLIQFGLAFLVGLLGISALIIRPNQKSIVRLWALSLVVSFCILLCIFWIWYLSYSLSIESNEVISNYENISTVLNEASQHNYYLNNSPQPVQIPTGIMIRNISIFNGSVKLTGLLWQKFPLKMDGIEKIAPRFPDQIGKTKVTEVYRFERNGKLVVGWFFYTELSQNFDFSHYPFDRNVVRILVEPDDFTLNAFWVPDIGEYEYMTPGQKPGLKNNLSSTGWNIVGSYFSYTRDTFNTSFGGTSNIYLNKYPVLTFNIESTRLLITPVITFGIVIIVLLVQIFGLLMFPVEKPKDAFSISSALFLVIAITHNTLRSALALNGTVFLEYFFILMYFLALGVGLISILDSMKVQIKILQQNALIPKLFFWPLVMTSILFVTLIVFYPN